VQRRNTLDWYANLLQISQLTAHLIIPVCELVASVQVKRFTKKSRQKCGATVLALTARALKVTLGTEVVKGYVTYGQWTFGIAWTAWLGLLCITETSRSSEIFSPISVANTNKHRLLASHQAIWSHRASQLPIHYLLAATH
jgi:hypothetical protein